MIPAALEQGLRLQAAELRRRLGAGMPRAGWKVCVNDGRLQEKLGLDGSFAGFLDGSRALATGDAWKVEEGSILGVEPEFAIRFRAGVAAGDAPEAIRRAIEGVAPAIEVVDWKDARLDLASLAASSSFHAGFVTGRLRGLDDVPAIGPGCPRLGRGDEILGVPDPSLVPSDLTAVVARVAESLAVTGEQIRAGDWLVAGACTNPARVKAGDVVEADFGRLGRVVVRFVA